MLHSGESQPSFLIGEERRVFKDFLRDVRDIGALIGAAVGKYFQPFLFGEVFLQPSPGQVG